MTLSQISTNSVDLFKKVMENYRKGYLSWWIC